MFWTGVSCWHKRYSDKTTLFLCWSHSFKNYTVVIMNWSIVTKYPILKWHYIDCVFTLSPTRLLQDFTGVISGTGTAYPSGAPEITPGFSEVRVTRSLISYVCFVDRCLSFCTFFLLTIVFSVLLRYTDSDYTFGIFKLFLQDLPIWETSLMS